MIRLILVALFLILYLILSLPVLLVEWLIGKWNPSLKDKSCKAYVDFAFRCIQALAGVNLIVRDRKIFLPILRFSMWAITAATLMWFSPSLFFRESQATFPKLK